MTALPPSNPNDHLRNAEALFLHAVEAVRQGDAKRALENAAWAVAALAAAIRAEREF